MRISNFLTPPYSSSPLYQGGRGLLWLNEIHHTYIGLFSALNHIFFFVITCVYEEAICLQITCWAPVSSWTKCFTSVFLSGGRTQEYLCPEMCEEKDKLLYFVWDNATIIGCSRSCVLLLPYCCAKNLICATLAFYYILCAYDKLVIKK